MKSQEIHYSDHLERMLGDTLTELNIPFIHESQGNGSRLDFYLPRSKVYIEVKQFHSDRVLNQLKSKDNIILLQGRGAVLAFIEFLKLTVFSSNPT